jgi:hypothetical protein
VSSVEQLTYPGVLRNHVGRLRSLEASGSPWIYVGTVGVDGVDDLISPDSPPFENGWTNSLGVDLPVSFTRINGWVHIRGGFLGGPDGSVVFNLPAGYRPAGRHGPHPIGTSDVAHVSTCYIEPNGDVVFGTVI